MEIWSNPNAVAARFEAAFGIALPPMGRSAHGGGVTLLRFEPTVWLVEGDVERLEAILGDDGALTAIGGGIVRVRIAGPGWRTLLMEGGAFDAESGAFMAGCCAATIIDHVAVRLMVEDEGACLAFVPASYAVALMRFWNDVLVQHPEQHQITTAT
jgi:heterotetrameric sarcosine oxidase gamma subunit